MTGSETHVTPSAEDPASNDPVTWSALEWAAALRDRRVSPTEAAEWSLARLDRINPTLNAAAHRDDERVLAAARAATERVAAAAQPSDLPPFLGVPIPIKDLNRLEGWPTSYGSEGASNDPESSSEMVVQRLLDAGFVPIAKSTTPEFGTISFTESARHGATRNPWDPTRTPGGSSGGSAAMVAAGIAPIGHASDGGGSIRIPSSCCGLVGLKPSRNRVGTEINALEGFTTQGVVTRTVADTAAVLDVIGRPNPLAWYNAPPPAVSFAEAAATPPGALRIGLVTDTPIGLPVDPEVVAATEAAGRLLESLGHHVAPVSLSLADVDAFIASFTTVWGAASAKVPITDWERIEPLNAALRTQGRGIDCITYAEAVITAQTIGAEIMAAFGRDYDVLLTPTMSVLPPEVGTVWAGAETDPVVALLNCYPMAVFTSVFNVTGLPALNLPTGRSTSGLPVGVQLVAGPWQDALLLGLGAQVEAAAPWRHRLPAEPGAAGSFGTGAPASAPD